MAIEKFLTINGLLIFGYIDRALGGAGILRLAYIEMLRILLVEPKNDDSCKGRFHNWNINDFEGWR